MYKQTKNRASEIAPHIYYALRDLQLGNIFIVLFVFSHQKYTVASWHRFCYTLLNK